MNWNSLYLKIANISTETQKVSIWISEFKHVLGLRIFQIQHTIIAKGWKSLKFEPREDFLIKIFWRYLFRTIRILIWRKTKPTVLAEMLFMALFFSLTHSGTRGSFFLGVSVLPGTRTLTKAKPVLKRK